MRTTILPSSFPRKEVTMVQPLTRLPDNDLLPPDGGTAEAT